MGYKLKIPFKVGPKGKEISFNAVSVLSYTKEDFAKRAQAVGWSNIMQADKIYAAAEKAKADYEAKNGKVAIEPHAVEAKKEEPAAEPKKEKPGK